MNDFSLIDKFKILMNIIASSPLFLTCSMIGTALLILLIISIKNEKKINKIIFISMFSILAIILIFGYSSVFLNLFDNLFDEVFTALYFPNLTVYLMIVIISNFFFIYSVFNKKMYKSHKIVNISTTILINIFLIVIIDIVKTNQINVYDTLTIYSNSNLLVLLELTSAIFTSWILLNLLITAYHKLKKYDKKEYPEMPEIIFD